MGVLTDAKEPAPQEPSEEFLAGHAAHAKALKQDLAGLVVRGGRDQCAWSAMWKERQGWRRGGHVGRI